MRTNTVKRLLKEGKPAIGTWLNFPCVNSAEAMAYAGWDWVTVDMEHGPIDFEMLNNMFMAIGSANVIPLCRIPDNDPVYIKRILDAGAMGIVVPMVNSAEEAAAAVRYAKYPPLGIRSAGGGRWRFGHAGGNQPDYMQHADDEIAVIVQIEHIDAVHRVEEILSVPGVDACFIGPNDLAWSMGLGKGAGEKDPSHAEAVAEVLRGAKKVGTPAGIHCRSVDEVSMRIEQGFQFCACMNDLGFMLNSASAGVKQIRERMAK
ncbi:MAG TPA: aldolase/citrate lyase family protein [Chloroflexota bacterium]